MHPRYARYFWDLSCLRINEQGQLVHQLFMQAHCRPIRGLHVIRERYLFFA